MDLFSKNDHEKELISNELYHVASQTIYSLLIGIKMALPLDMDPTLKEYLIELEKNSDQSLEKIRELAFKLHPLMIKDLGFIPTLRTYINKLEEKYNKKINLVVTGQMSDPHIEKDILLYRVCHESLLYLEDQGIKEIIVSIDFKDEETTIKIASTVCNCSPNHININNIIDHLLFTKKRVESNGGTFDIKLVSCCELIIEVAIPNIKMSPQKVK